MLNIKYFKSCEATKMFFSKEYWIILFFVSLIILPVGFGICIAVEDLICEIIN